MRVLCLYYNIVPIQYFNILYTAEQKKTCQNILESNRVTYHSQYTNIIHMDTSYSLLYYLFLSRYDTRLRKTYVFGQL